MLEVDAHNAATYLASRGHLAPGQCAEVVPLTGGVSNVVLRVNRPAGDDFVVKQSRERLRTRAEWRSRLDRIEREGDLMAFLADRLPPGSVPRILFREPDDHLVGMEAIAADHRVWKSELLAGRIDPDVGRAAGRLLAAIHATTAGDASAAERFGDRTVFDELRLDPFYRYVAARSAAVRDPLSELIAETESRAECVVHADFSPKNLLLAGDRLVLVDHETGHFGDPAFDVGFFFSHLLLKWCGHGTAAAAELIREAWRAYEAVIREANAFPVDDARERRRVLHLAACALARIDGKSPVDYLDAGRRDFVREIAVEWLNDPPRSVPEAFDAFARSLASGRRRPAGDVHPPN